MNILKKTVLVLLIIIIMFNSLPLYALDYGESENSNTLHFIVDHLHSAKLVRTDDSEETEEIENSQNHVTIEGYIEKSGDEFKFYIIDGDQKINISNPKASPYSEYIESVNPTDGTITLKSNPLQVDGTYLERFTSFTISAGHNSTKISDDGQNVVISYLDYVHLVKLNAYYVNENMKVAGSGVDDAVFGNSDAQTNKEQDTSWVYLYKDVVGDHQIGEIVRDPSTGEPITEESNLPADIVDHVELTKIYSTLSGLHTDKSIKKVADDDRTFNIDLESWFSGAKAASIGLVLDASGSMVFTSDKLDPINIKELDISDELKQQLMDKALSKANFTEQPSDDDWDNIFLTNEEVNEILNTNYTDNNPLSDSSYNYYVFDKDPSVNEYSPLGYWDGTLGNQDKLIGYYEFNRGTYETNSERDWLKNSVTGNDAEVVNQIDISQFNDSTTTSFSKGTKPENWSSDKRIAMSTAGLKVKDLTDGLGVLLDVKPTSKENFTISFTVTKENSSSDSQEDVKANTDDQNYTDLIYIGPLDNIQSSDYYRVLRDGTAGGSVSTTGNSRNRLRGYQNGFQAGYEMLTNVNNVFKNENETHTITIVVKDGILNTYDNGVKSDEAYDKPISLTDDYIIINGFDNNYGGALLHIDNVRVYDTALTSDEVSDISNEEKITPKDEYIAYNTYGNNQIKTAMTRGFFVEQGKGNLKGMEGWYYVNHDSEWTGHYFNKIIESAKVLWGLTSIKDENVVYTDEFTVPTTNPEEEHISTSYTYKPTKNSPTKFYIDENGFLCCFYTRGTHQSTAGASYVYTKDDSADIKVEALQHAIGSFASKLAESSPSSLVSAVRYNLDLEDKDTNYAEDFDKFVLLDWTNEPSKIQSFMSLTYGDGGTRKGTLSTPVSSENEPLEQYNYGVTGGTTTYVGFKTYNDILDPRLKDGDYEKYLIVFTDGKDTSTTEQQATILDMTNALKDDGYTIIGVMLTGGSIEYSELDDSDYKTAKDFILQFIGTKGSTPEENKKYFFSTAELDNIDIDSSEDLTNIDILTEIFTSNILEEIADNLTDYSVKDYIDPRFNLVSSAGREYSLDADGIVTIYNKDGKSIYAKYNLKTGETLQNPSGSTVTLTKDVNEGSGRYFVNLRLSNDVGIDAPRAQLLFDEGNNMYYLKWVDQTIPGCVPNVKKLSVWNARITVRAKEDFIGGNAVLTNGNEENMNYVYSELDTNPSSGIEDNIRIEGTNDYPSKGFPRVTANVAFPTTEKEDSKTIYMGEGIDYNDIKQKLFNQVKKEPENETILYYLDYIDRYEKYNSLEQGSKMKELLSTGTLTIPYSYLPNTAGTNLAGNNEHKADILGNLKYTIEIVDEGKGDGAVINDKVERKLTLTVSYIPNTIDVHSTTYDDLVIDTHYAWDRAYKPTAGEQQVEKPVIVSKYSVNIVSGEVALEVVFDSQTSEVLKGQDIEYTADLCKDGTKIGTFRAVYDESEEPNIDSEGNLILKAILEYDEPYKAYMKDNGLPYGKYTLQNQHVVSPQYISFKDYSVVKDDDRYIDSLFSVGSDCINPKAHLATLNDTEIILGDKTNPDTYLDKRFGLYEVRAIAEFRLPQSGSNSLIKLYIAIGACLIISLLLKLSTITKKNK